MNFVFPNEVHVTWTVMIVLYPYITGLVAGAFIVSSLYHVFGRERAQARSRASRWRRPSSSCSSRTLPLLIHLGHPERAFNIMITPNFTSAMAGFGYIYSDLPDPGGPGDLVRHARRLHRRAPKDAGPVAWLCRAILLFNTARERRRPARPTTRSSSSSPAWASRSPASCTATSGFLFGSIKANPWWSTPLMFVIFIFSAIVSGISVLIFHYFVVCRINGWKVDQRLRPLARPLPVGLHDRRRRARAHGAAVPRLRADRGDGDPGPPHPDEAVRVLRGPPVPASARWFPSSCSRITALFKLRERTAHLLIWLSACLLLLQVLLMRWNVVIGGQLVSKSMRGFTSYFPGIWEKEGPDHGGRHLHPALRHPVRLPPHRSRCSPTSKRPPPVRPEPTWQTDEASGRDDLAALRERVSQLEDRVARIEQGTVLPGRPAPADAVRVSRSRSMRT